MDAPETDSDDGQTGMSVRALDGKAIVTVVLPESPAEKNGVCPGWQIVRISGEDLAPIMRDVSAAYEGSTLQQAMLARVVEARLVGPVGKAVAVEFLADDDLPVTRAIPRVAPPGRKAVLGHMPPFYVRHEARRLDENIGYIAFNGFFDPTMLMKAFEDAVLSFMDADGIIIDLRGNPGGLGAMAMGMSGWLIEHAERPLGTMRTREVTINLVIFPRPQTYAGPVAVLIDGCSASTSEFLAGGLQDLGRARIFGLRSAGAALPSAFEKLPNGDGFQYVMGDYVTGDGRRLEGAGVIPDVEVMPTRAQLLAGRDPILEAAVEWIRSQH